MRHFYILSIALWPISLLISQNLADDHLRLEPKMIYELFSKNHYEPKLVDDEFSKKLFKATLYDIDEQGLLLLDQDVASIKKFETKLDEEFTQGDWQFIDAVTIIYKSRIKSALKALDEIALATPSYTQADTIYIHSENRDYLKDDKALKAAWLKKIKYQILWQLIYENTDKVNTKEFDFAAKEVEVRKKVIKRQRKKLERLIVSDSKIKNTLCETYFEAFVHLFDPHSSYFSKESWAEFFTSLSSNDYVFGIAVEENATGELEISGIMPGGPAWKSNELHKKDLIKSITYNGKAVDMEELGEEELDAILSQKEVNHLDLLVQKTDGSIKKVSLTKDKVKNDRNIIKSYVISGTKKIGYISLPGFYVDSDNNNGLGCANDVAKEIIKLKVEGIQGLIFDIRYNGGGSMREAQDLSGLFIGEGPLFSIKDQAKAPIVMKDLNRGTIYDGPMVVMVNGQSASASEIFASTLQDYNRAVIVGSQTYGKATGQSTIPLGVDMDTEPTADLAKTGLGGVSITRLKLYRLTGKSNQKMGVSPDIFMPDLYKKMSFGEEAYIHALENDETTKKPLFKALPALPLTKLKENSAQRQSTNASFTRLKTAIEQTPSILAKLEETAIPLTVKGMYPILKSYKSWVEDLAKLNETNPKDYKVTATKIENQIAQLDTVYNDVQKEVIEELERDIFVQESYKIMLDLITFTAK